MLRVKFQKRFSKLVGVIGHVGHGKNTLFEKLRSENANLQTEYHKKLRVFPAFTTESGVTFLNAEITKKIDPNLISCYLLVVASNSTDIQEPTGTLLRKIKSGQKNIPIIVCFTKTDLKVNNSELILLDILENFKEIDIGRNDPVVYWCKHDKTVHIYQTLLNTNIENKIIPSFCLGCIETQNQHNGMICFLPTGQEIMQSNILESDSGHYAKIKSIMKENGELVTKPETLKCQDSIAIITGWNSKLPIGSTIQKIDRLPKLPKKHDIEKSVNKKKFASTYLRIFIHSHHIYSKIKRKNLIYHGTDFGLNGVTKAGKPGIIIIEGHRDLVRKFWKIIKSWKWQHIEIRHEENLMNESDLKFDSYNEIKSTSLEDLKNLLNDRGCGNVYDKLFGSSWVLEDTTLKQETIEVEKHVTNRNKQDLLFEDL